MITLLIAGLLLLQLVPALAQPVGGIPADDPLGIWKVQPPEPAKDDNYSAPPPPPPPHVVPVKKEKPRTEEPMDDETKLFDRKEYVVDNGKDPKHTLTYFWKQPKVPASPADRYPLVIILHDAKGFAPAGRFLARRDFRHDFPAFIAVPVLPVNKIWSFPESFPDDRSLDYMANIPQALSDVVEMIPDLVKDNPIDRRRIYIVGCAEGGFGAYGAAMRHSDIFAAAVPINGGWAIRDSRELTKIPLFVLHGEKDAVFAPKLSRDVAYYIQLYGGNVSYVQVPGLGHDCTDPRLYTRTLWEWLFEQRKKRN